MAKGVMVYKRVSDTKDLVLSFTVPISELAGYQDLIDTDEGLQDQIDKIVAGEIGVHTWNGRDGEVVPEDGDYTAAQVGADPTGSAQNVQNNLNADIALRQTYIVSNIIAQTDTSTLVTIINGPRVYLDLEILNAYEVNDLVSFHVELPDVLGSAGNAEVLFELIFDEGLPSEIIVASEQNRIGNTQGPFNFDIKGITSQAVALGAIRLYGTAVVGTTTADGSIEKNFMLAERTRNFSIKAYPP